MEIQKNTHRTTSVAAATAYGDASRSWGCGLECATPMLTRRRDHNVDRRTGDGKYSASSAYRSFFFGRTLLIGAKHLWHEHAPPKVKFFFWIGLHGRL